MAALSNEEIKTLVEAARAHFEVSEVATSSGYQAQLLLEEILVRYQRVLGKSCSYSFELRSSSCVRSVVLMLAGLKYNARLEGEDSSGGNLMGRLLGMRGVKCGYSYRRGTNIIILSVRRSFAL